jgi:polyhydroxybutyrate depolymerase
MPTSRRRSHRWHILAETANFVVVYPQGTSFPTRWNAGRFGIAGDDSADDVQFFRDLITDLSRTLCIDPERIFVNGLSNGGGMANRLGCELADRIAAIGGVSGAYSDIPGGCKPSRPVPVIAFHGTADRIVPIDGSPGIGLPPIKDWAAGWAARNGCNAPPATIPAKGEVGGLRYTGCKDSAEVIYYIIETGGHTWPGGPPFPFGIGGKVTKDIDATTTMWEFFKAHPLTLRK